LGQVAAWLAAARGGSADALGRVLDLYRPYLLQVANGELDPQLHAKLGPSDIVQETFLEAQRVFERFRGDSAEELRAWLRAILLNKVGTHTRHYRATAKRQLGKEIGLGPAGDRQADLTDMVPTPSSLAVQKERVLALAQAVQRLPENYRQIVSWRQAENLSFEEMASRLGRSVEAVRKLWWRAIQKLQQELGDSL
jgi:RNA polymerase sigma-70 factor (ECF subfamily)